MPYILLAADRSTAALLALGIAVGLANRLATLGFYSFAAPVNSTAGRRSIANPFLS